MHSEALVCRNSVASIVCSHAGPEAGMQSGLVTATVFDASEMVAFVAMFASASATDHTKHPDDPVFPK